jgi:hypothetical protein
MKALIRYAAVLLAAYLVAWTISYVVVMYNAIRRVDFSQYVHWFFLAWSFRGLEMVAITWLLSIAAFIPLAVVAILLVRKFTRPAKPLSE